MQKKPKTCILHVGVHKTGTTAIQKALEGYDDGTSRYADLDHANHSIPLNMVFGQPADMDAAAPDSPKDKYLRALGEAMERKLRRELELDRERIVISGEVVSTFEPTALRAMATLLNEYCDRVEVQFFVRSPLSWTASWLQQSLKRGLPINAKRISGHLSDKYQNLCDAFGTENVRVHRYEDKAQFGGDIVALFIDRLGLNVGLVKKNRNIENQSLPEATTQAIYRLNQIDGFKAIYHNIPEVRGQFIFALNNASGSTRPLDHRMFASAVDRDDYSKINALLDTPYDIALDPAGDLETYLMKVDPQLMIGVNKSLKEKGILEHPTDDTDLALSLFFVLTCGKAFEKLTPR